MKKKTDKPDGIGDESDFRQQLPSHEFLLPEEPTAGEEGCQEGKLLPPVRIGEADVDPLAATRGGDARSTGQSVEEGGMLIGPKHPIFGSPAPPASSSTAGNLERPPGARFDPVGPFPAITDPDADELLPPHGGNQGDAWEMGPDGKPRRVAASGKGSASAKDVFGLKGVPKPPNDPFGGSGGRFF